MNTTVVRFAIVGLLSTGLYFALLISLQTIVPSTLWLTAFCYMASMVFNYFAQGRYTFRNSNTNARNVRRYALMHLVALVFNSGAMTVLVDIAGSPLLPSQICVTALVAIGTYLVSKQWVFAAT